MAHGWDGIWVLGGTGHVEGPWGLLGQALGTILAPKGAPPDGPYHPRAIGKPILPKMVLKWNPFWTPFSTFFCIYGLKMAPQTLFEHSLVAKRWAEQLERELGRQKPIFEGFGHHRNVAKT